MIYFAVYLEDNKHFSNLECFGFYLNYFVYGVEPQVFVKLEFIGRRVVFIHDEKVALASKFAGTRREFIRVSGDFENLKKRWPENLLVPHKPNKWSYYLTNEDKKNAVAFMKIIIRDTIFKHYENMFLMHKPHTSLLHDKLEPNNESNQLLYQFVEEIDNLSNDLNSVSDIAGCNDFVHQFEIKIGF